MKTVLLTLIVSASGLVMYGLGFASGVTAETYNILRKQAKLEN